MARPARRNKKAVDYSQFDNADSDDEDFACIPAPSNKKSKNMLSESTKEKMEQQKKAPQKEIHLQKGSPNENFRVALDDKLYQRNLEVALALSVNEPLGSDHKVPHSQDQDLDDIANECNTTVGNFGRASISKQKLQTKGKDNGDSANNYELEPASISAEESERDSSFNEDDRDEFVVKKKTKENRKEGRKLHISTEKKTKKPSKSKRNVMVQAESQPVLQNASISSEPIGKPLQTSSPSAVKKPNWIPPVASGSSTSQVGRVLVKSPTQVLRLGLSRLAKVKPLHPSLAST